MAKIQSPKPSGKLISDLSNLNLSVVLKYLSRYWLGSIGYFKGLSKTPLVLHLTLVQLRVVSFKSYTILSDISVLCECSGKEAYNFLNSPIGMLLQSLGLLLRRHYNRLLSLLQR